jgi:hypothetical protein
LIVLAGSYLQIMTNGNHYFKNSWKLDLHGFTVFTQRCLICAAPLTNGEIFEPLTLHWARTCNPAALSAIDVTTRESFTSLIKMNKN